MNIEDINVKKLLAMSMFYNSFSRTTMLENWRWHHKCCMKTNAHPDPGPQLPLTLGRVVAHKLRIFLPTFSTTMLFHSDAEHCVSAIALRKTQGSANEWSTGGVKRVA